MTYRFVEGDIFKEKIDVIVHGCNAKGKFAKGFAEQVRKYHPFSYLSYMETFKRGGLILGSVIWADDGKRLIGNAITQPTLGNTGLHLSYDALRACLENVNLAAQFGIEGTRFQEGFSTVAMPMIGAGLAGGEWSKIESIIKETLTHVDVVVYRRPEQNVPSIRT